MKKSYKFDAVFCVVMLIKATIERVANIKSYDIIPINQWKSDK